MNNTLDELMGEIQSSNLDYCPESLSQFNNDLEEEKKSKKTYRSLKDTTKNTYMPTYVLSDW